MIPLASLPTARQRTRRHELSRQLLPQGLHRGDAGVQVLQLAGHDLAHGLAGVGGLPEQGQLVADLGQGEELEPARKKAELLGIKPKNIYIDDLREEFVRDFVFPMFRANTLYEGQYLLGTSIARPLIAQRQIEIAEMTGADAVAHVPT